MSDGPQADFAIRKGKEARAWRRALLDDKGNLHADGKAILGGMIRFADYFGPGYSVAQDVDNTAKTFILAARREMVNRILFLLKYDETHILAMLREPADD